MERTTVKMALMRACRSAVSALLDVMRNLLLKVTPVRVCVTASCVPLEVLEINEQECNNLNETTNETAGISDDFSKH